MSQPFMQLYVGDYIRDTMDLSTEEHGAYLLLLMTMWSHDAKLPNDQKKLARIARLSPAKFKRVWAGIERFFTVEGDYITQGRLTKEHQKAQEKGQKRAQAGAKGGRAKSLKRKEAGLANASDLLKHSPEPEPDIREEPKGSLSSGDDAQPFDEIAECVSAYNDTARDAGWPEVRVLSKARRSALSQRLKECGGIEGWRHALAKARASPHCCGQNDRGWTANFDFLTRQSSFAKLMEGNYDNRAGKSDTGPDASTRQIAYAARFVRSPSADCF